MHIDAGHLGVDLLTCRNELVQDFSLHKLNSLKAPRQTHGCTQTLESDICAARYVTPCNLIKSKATPLQDWSVPEGSRKLRFPDFMTTTQDGGKVISLTHQPPLPAGSTPGTHFCSLRY
jgi:hypothetical protein